MWAALRIGFTQIRRYEITIFGCISVGTGFNFEIVIAGAFTDDLTAFTRHRLNITLFQYRAIHIAIGIHTVQQ